MPIILWGLTLIGGGAIGYALRDAKLSPPTPAPSGSAPPSPVTAGVVHGIPWRFP